MNNVDGLVESADAAGVQLDRLTAAFSVGYNMGLRVKDCWNAEHSALAADFHFVITVPHMENPNEAGMAGYEAVSDLFRDVVRRSKRNADCVLCAWSCSAGDATTAAHLKLVMSNADAFLRFAPVLRQVFLHLRKTPPTQQQQQQQQQKQQQHGRPPSPPAPMFVDAQGPRPSAGEPSAPTEGSGNGGTGGSSGGGAGPPLVASTAAASSESSSVAGTPKPKGGAAVVAAAASGAPLQLQLKGVALQCSAADRARVSQEMADFSPGVATVIYGFQNYSDTFRTAPRPLDCVVINCVFRPKDFMLPQAKEIAAGTLETLKQSTACYSANWSIDDTELRRQEVFVNCGAATRFYQENARRAMMLLQESVMKLTAVEVLCHLHDADAVRKLFEPAEVDVREFSAGFQTFPVF